jgi:hypothetical protein
LYLSAAAAPLSFFLSIALVYLEVNNNQRTPGGVERQQHNFNSH